ncbi:MAG: lipoyl(octanoyl) transferase LipB [Desulfobacteraceae bacterium]|nr:lipoyl(octanoyl) transferase LipB [Desulfobacteraceae bacterium]
MTPEKWVTDLGLIEYQEAYVLQRQISLAKTEGDLDSDVILVLEHPPVFTLGKRGGAENLRVAPAFLKEKGIAVIPTRRGGNITYHGPGQIVVYPIVDIARAGIGVADFVNALEETMILTCRAFGVNAARNPQNHGIWVENDKIGSIGLAVKHGVCHHGLALNVNLDLTPFSWINPCGLSGVGMTSMARDLGGEKDSEMTTTVKSNLLENLGQVTGFSFKTVTPEQLKRAL